VFKVVIDPQGVEALLSAGSCLTELEFELYGEDSVPFGCKVGACGACVVEVIEGLANLGIKGRDEQRFLEKLGYSKEVFRLACQCHLNGAVRIRAVSSPQE
jgi:ferredoxin